MNNNVIDYESTYLHINQDFYTCNIAMLDTFTRHIKSKLYSMPIKHRYESLALYINHMLMNYTAQTLAIEN